LEDFSPVGARAFVLQKHTLPITGVIIFCARRVQVAFVNMFIFINLVYLCVFVYADLLDWRGF